ncbi:MAG: hypothetical protein COB14_09540 [Alphaproteobacteria bacterium]|nr:MAG: hypothetical protein COB14_09540 [Alphaproteobacteria bacterium]
MIEFVDMSNNCNFIGNPILEQHKLRYNAIIERQDWNVPSYKKLEFDQYDNPATKYLIYRDEGDIVRGVSRFYPTTLPYMLEEQFSHFVTDMEIPKNERIWEGSRFCIDNTLNAPSRKKIINEIVVAYLEACLFFDVHSVVGLMYPAYWRGLFIQAGWPIEFIGDVIKLDDGHKARAAILPVSQSILANVRETTGIHYKTVNFGEYYERKKAA